MASKNKQQERKVWLWREEGTVSVAGGAPGEEGCGSPLVWWEVSLTLMGMVGGRGH